MTSKHKIYHFKSLTSTQDKAEELSKKGINTAVVIADTQTRGKGRFDRKWHSSKEGLWISILLSPNEVDKLQYLTFIAAISVQKTIKKFTKINLKIKWPNDIHYKKKKLCGILTKGIFGRKNHAIVGIGLNVNQTKFSKDISKIASSLKLILDKDFDKEKLAKNIINEFFNMYKNHYQKNKFKEIKTLWKKNCDTLGKKVIVKTASKKITGKAIDVDENCSLLIRTNKKIIKIVEGDVALRF
jgi:BirA family transcriptional regulator, biotin operon repressor / biotin---[acetyl-CoA-carboxylase] ligase